MFNLLNIFDIILDTYKEYPIKQFKYNDNDNIQKFMIKSNIYGNIKYKINPIK